MAITHIDQDPFILPSVLDIPRHLGDFFELGLSELQRLKVAGYKRVGVGMALLNRAGQVLVLEHKGNQKVADRMLGITTETIGGQMSIEGMQVETTVNTMGRCIEHEIGDDPTAAQITTRLDRSFVLSDWPVGVDPSLGKLLGINVALLLDDATARSFLAHATDTAEAHCAYFEDPNLLIEIGDQSPRIRPGTADCLKSLRDEGLLDVEQLMQARLDIPSPSLIAFDIDLSTI